MVFLTILFFLLLPHLLGPVLIRLSNKQEAYPEFNGLRYEELPSTVAAAFARSRDMLRGLGFEQIACLYKAGSAENVRTYLILLVNRATNEAAIVFDMMTAGGVAPIHRLVTEFSTDLSNGVEVSTSDGGDPIPYRKNPEKHLYKFPEVKNPWALYNLHRQMVSRHAAPGVYAYLPTPGNEIQALSASINKTLMKQVEFGYLYLDKRGEFFRPTWKGAILMTWKLAWPAGMIQRALIKRRARHMMKQLRHAWAY
ncbi:MAG: hypothetical protein ICV60_08935 [Pyrinomonadaceae bacterium]|nr:hypothetical protein [Pyrinomonadaceae bacterium]